jgi:hypothetical protein
MNDVSQVLGNLVTKSLDFTSSETGALHLPFSDILALQLTF